ncbi:MAG: TetR/AcrR family transcriptional regulator [Rikenellaceae bacterium]|nr:TetR/AcrR family transcriptional regulator [Rikenellaceae bacterium]
MKRGPRKSINGINLGEAGVSTRQIILDKASQLINESGMSEFRIDALAASLGLSPGNITYHFPRKEDIGNAIWIAAVQEITSSLDHYMSSLLDIKQLFLFYKYVVSLVYKHRGVFYSKLGDIGLIGRNRGAIIDTMKTVEYAFDKKMTALTVNGYVDPRKYDSLRRQVFDSMVTCLGWWTTGVMDDLRGDAADIAAVSDRYALIMVMLLSPVLTESGRAQLDAVCSLVKRDI